MKFFIFVILSFSSSAYGLIRFDAEQLKFTLQDQSGLEVDCQHQPLVTGSEAEPPPWWTVNCGKRQYTVDIWMDLFISQDKLFNVYVLFHAKESVSSSGQKLTRFNTQTARLKFKEISHLTNILMSIDVRNGLADLKVEVSQKNN